jgi:acetyl esterase/lipase
MVPETGNLDPAASSFSESQEVKRSVLRWRSVGLLSLSALVLLLLLVKFGEPTDWFVDPSVQVKEDVVYRKTDGQQLTLDLARPASAKAPTPVLVFIHGGAWQYEGRAFSNEIQRAARRGYAALRIRYRLMDIQDDGRARYPFPAQLEDVTAALDWIAENAQEKNFDTKRVGLVGMSAGGQLALLAGLDRSSEENGKLNVRGIVNYYGPTDFVDGYARHQEGRRLLETFLCGSPETQHDRYVAASPVCHVQADSPPVLTFQGDADRVVPLEQSELLDAKMKAAGAIHTLQVFRGEAHGFSRAAGQRANRQMYDFLDQHVGGPSLVGAAQSKRQRAVAGASR